MNSVMNQDFILLSQSYRQNRMKITLRNIAVSFSIMYRLMPEVDENAVVLHCGFEVIGIWFAFTAFSLTQKLSVCSSSVERSRCSWFEFWIWKFWLMVFRGYCRGSHSTAGAHWTTGQQGEWRCLQLQSIEYVSVWGWACGLVSIIQLIVSLVG